MHNVGQMKKFISGPCFDTYYLTQFEMLPLSDYLNLTLDLHIISPQFTHSQTIYGIQADRPWARIFQHDDHYSGLISREDTFPLNLDYDPDIVYNGSYDLNFPTMAQTARPPSPVYKTAHKRTKGRNLGKILILLPSSSHARVHKRTKKLKSHKIAVLLLILLPAKFPGLR